MADSLQIYDTLKSTFPEAETRAVTKALEIAHFDTASKTDLKSAMAELRAELKADIKTAIAQAEVRLIRWMFLFWIGQVGVMTAILLAMVHALKA